MAEDNTIGLASEGTDGFEGSEGSGGNDNYSGNTGGGIEADDELAVEEIQNLLGGDANAGGLDDCMTGAEDGSFGGDGGGGDDFITDGLDG